MYLLYLNSCYCNVQCCNVHYWVGLFAFLVVWKCAFWIKFWHNERSFAKCVQATGKHCKWLTSLVLQVLVISNFTGFTGLGYHFSLPKTFSYLVSNDSVSLGFYNPVTFPSSSGGWPLGNSNLAGGLCSAPTLDSGKDVRIRLEGPSCYENSVKEAHEAIAHL